jgi:uncharacterized membrane protein
VIVVVEVVGGINLSIQWTVAWMKQATGVLGGHAHFLHWGVVQISLANLIVIVLMLIVFTLAVVIPFPHGNDDIESKDSPDVPT